MNDDIFERFIKSVGIVIGGYLLLYCLIITTQKHPRGIALKIVVATEFVVKGLFYIALVGGVIALLALLIETHLTKKRIKKEEEERIESERNAQLVYLEQEIESLKRQLKEANEQKNKYLIALNEEKTRRVEFENHLENRTPQAAVSEALGHFL